MEGAHPGIHGYVFPGTGSGRVSAWKLQIFDPRYRVWEGGHTGDCAQVTLGSGSGERGVRNVILDIL